MFSNITGKFCHCFLVLSLTSVGSFGQREPQAPQAGAIDPDRAGLAWLVPSSAGVFVEFIDLGAHYSARKPSPVWRAVMGLVGLGEDSSGNGGMAGPIRSQLGLSTEAAMGTLFGREVALALPSWDRSAEGVLLARLASPTALRTVLKARPWKAQRTRGRIRSYMLESGLRLVTDGRTAVIGQALPKHPFLESCLDLLAGRGGRSLADNPSFIGLTEELPYRRLGLAYVGRGGSAPADSDTGSATMPLFAGLQRAAIACVEIDAGLGFRVAAEVDREGSLPGFDLAPGSGAPGPALPHDAWLSATVNASAEELLGWVQTRSPKGPAALLVQLLRTALVGARPGDDLFSHLSRPTTVVVSPAGRQAGVGGRPPLPRAALVMRATDSAAAMSAFDGAMERLVHFANLRLAPVGGEGPGPGGLEIETVGESGGQARHVSLAPLASSADAGDPNRDLHLAWGIAGDYFVVSSDVQHLRELRSALGSETLAESSGSPAGRESWLQVEARMGKLEILATQWLAYVAVQFPEVLADEGWSEFLAGRPGRQAALGAGLRADPDQPGLVRVVRIFRGMPAERSLRPGDAIVGVQGRLLALGDPLDDLRAALAGRSGREVTLRVQRGGRLKDVVVRLEPQAVASGPADNPLLAMEPLLELAAGIDRLQLSVVRSAGRWSAEIDVRFTSAPRVTTVGPAHD